MNEKKDYNSVGIYVWAVFPLIMAMICYFTYKFSFWDNYIVLSNTRAGMFFYLIWALGIFESLIVGCSIWRIRENLNVIETLKEKSKYDKWIIAFLLLLLWSFVSFLLSDDRITSLGLGGCLTEGWLAYVLYAMCFWIAYNLNCENVKGKFGDYLILVSNVLAFVTVAWEKEQQNLMTFNFASSTSVFANSNHYGYFLCMTILLSFGKYIISTCEGLEQNDKKFSLKTWAYLASFVFQVYVLMINDTLGAYVAVIFAMVFTLILWRIRLKGFRATWLIPPIVLIIITYLSYIGIITNLLGETIGDCLKDFMRDIMKVSTQSEGYEQAGTNRIFLWKVSIEMIKKHPFIGYGPEGLTGEYRAITGGDRPHNEYLQWANFCGIPGLACYLFALISLCINRCKKVVLLDTEDLVIAGAVIAYLISAFFGVTMYYTVPYLYIFLGFIAGGAKHNLKKN